MNEPVEEGATVVTEGRAGVSVDLKLVFTTRVLQRQKHSEEREDALIQYYSDPGGFSAAPASVLLRLLVKLSCCHLSC